jgi:phenylpropionate dioxygenase-like ring-hydroxylating dioxygenase large terminal subunit
MNVWYPVALSGGVEPGSSCGTRVHGKEFVVWRDQAGVSHVWEDRCPHRGMRLSFGFVRGFHIACLYHGWQFDAAGQCRLIPAHPDITVPKTIRANRYPSMECLGIIWLQLPGESDVEFPNDPEMTTEVRSLTIEATPKRVLIELENRRIARINVDGLPVIVALQPLSGAETVLHLVIEAAVGADERKRVSAWGAALRTRVEGS